MYNLLWETLKCWSSLKVWVELASGLKWPHLSVMVISSQRGGVVHHYQKEIFSYTTVFKNTCFSKSVSSKNSLRRLSHYNRYFFQSKDSLISIYFFLWTPSQFSQKIQGPASFLPVDNSLLPEWIGMTLENLLWHYHIFKALQHWIPAIAKIIIASSLQTPTLH